MPLPEYTFFIDKFADAIRIEIARSAERSYDSLKLVDMMKMFTIGDKEELNAFIATNNNKDGIVWENNGQSVTFIKEKKEASEIPAMRMI